MKVKELINTLKKYKEELEVEVVNINRVEQREIKKLLYQNKKIVIFY